MRNLHELIVVVVIAVILAGITGRALSSGAGTWRETRCLDNLRGLHLLAGQYAEAHAGYLPIVADRIKPRWIFWYRKLLVFAEDGALFYCPSSPKAAAYFDKMPDPLLPVVFSEPMVSYGMNYALSINYRLDSALSPAHTILLGDSRSPSLRPTRQCWEDDYAPYHLGGSHFLLFDGHAEKMDSQSLGLMDAFKEWNQDRNRWNNFK